MALGLRGGAVQGSVHALWLQADTEMLNWVPSCTAMPRLQVNLNCMYIFVMADREAPETWAFFTSLPSRCMSTILEVRLVAALLCCGKVRVQVGQ